jgi:hypothetical protein
VPQGNVTSYTFNNVITDHSIYASFTGMPLTIVSTASSGGSISPDSTINLNYNDPNDYSYTMTPEDPDDVLLDVIVDGVSVGTPHTYTFYGPITASHTIFAKFRFDTASVLSLPTTFGQITPFGSTAYREDMNPTYTVTADPGYVISSVIVDGSPVPLVTSKVSKINAVGKGVSDPASFSYTFDEIEGAHTIGAIFAPISYVKPVKTFATFMPQFYNTYIQERQSRLGYVEKSELIGSKRGGDEITLHFHKFNKPPTKVLFDGVAAGIILAGDHSVVVKTPPHVPGKVDVVISNAKQTVTLPGKFTYK